MGRDRRSNLRLFDRRIAVIRDYVVRRGMAPWRVHPTLVDKVDAPATARFNSRTKKWVYEKVNGSFDLVKPVVVRHQESQRLD
jgi:hypothetical protein